MKKFWESLKNNICFILAFTAIFILFGIIINLQCNIQAKQDIINQSVTEMKQLEDGSVRDRAQYVTKDDLNKLAKDLNLESIKTDLDELDAKLQGISEILVKSLGDHRTNQPSTHVIPNTDPPGPTDPLPGTDSCEDPLEPWCIPPASAGYLQNEQVQDLEEPFSNMKVPIGSVSFKAWKNNPWDINILPRDYKIASVLGQDKDGKHYMYHKFTINSDGKDHTVQIDDAKFVEQLPESSFEWWNPKFGLGVTMGLSIPTSPISSDGEPTSLAADIAPSVYFSPFSYGKTTVKPSWIFGQVGVGYSVINKTFQVSLSPAKYNLGTNTEIINNTYIGPTIAIDTDKNVSAAGTLSVTF